MNNNSDFVEGRNNIIQERHIEKDPIRGITGDFDIVDLVDVKETEKILTHNSILFVPSDQNVQIDDPIITIHIQETNFRLKS